MIVLFISKKTFFFCFLSFRRLSFILNASLGSFFGIAFADWAFFSDHKQTPTRLSETILLIRGP